MLSNCRPVRSAVVDRGARAALIAAACLICAACDAYDASLLPPRSPPPAPLVDGGHADEDAGQVGLDCMGSGERMCMRPNADATCVDAVCLIVRCKEPFLDCDGVADNGCEATLDSALHCGACRASCLREHVAFARCDLTSAAGPCLIDHSCPLGAPGCTEGDPRNGCQMGFGDCDSQPENGCETSLHTLTDCGGCGEPCTSVDAEVSCETGACVEIGCAPGFGDCRGAGCESLAGDAMHCGECGNACALDTPMCHGGRCTEATCAEGTADCDDDVENGCETALDQVDSCGLCGTKCGPYPNAQPGCSSGQCLIADCDGGYANCDGERTNGCEVDLTLAESCGRCGNDCGALPHVESSMCNGGQCAQLTCEEGWGNCDGNPGNGCEQPLGTAAHCGACGQPCELANAVSDCSTGRCQISSCKEGFDDCNGEAPDGCEAALDSDDHCGSCGSECQAGTSCQNGMGCGCSAGVCPQGAECCSGACVNTHSDCFPWPCIPGTTADRANCGACGQPCGLFCCLIP